MKWMGGWSCQDHDDAPQEIIEQIIEMINEEAAEMEAARNKG